MSGFLHLPGAVESNPTATAGDGPSADGDVKFADFRFEIRRDSSQGAGIRICQDGWGTFYLYSNGATIGCTVYPGSAKSKTCLVDTSFADGDWVQVRAVVDWTANPAVHTFYERATGPDIDNNTGWTQLATYDTAEAWGVMTLVHTTATAGGASSAWTGDVRQWFVGYGATDASRTWVHGDVRNLTPTEIAAASFVGDDLLTWTLNGAGWTWERGREAKRLAGPGQLLHTGG